mmetsp:Transcript_27952/g.60137  ORF Transcript_27952/g.60137 Transcript_27952/m.60137 type:complete len:137 (+) Transcript_27952:209-619(+)
MMNGAFSLITIVLLGCWGLAFSVASAFIVGSIQTQQHTTTNCRTATTTEHRYCNVVPEPRGLHRMASSTTSSELSDSIPDKTMEEVWRYAKKTLDLRRRQGSNQEARKFVAATSGRPHGCKSKSEHEILWDVGKCL